MSYRRRPPADNPIVPEPEYRNAYWESTKDIIKCFFCRGLHDGAGRQLDDKGKLVKPPTCPRSK